MVASISRGLIVFAKTFDTVNPQYLTHQNYCTLVGQNIWYACYICREDNNSSGDLEFYVH